MFLAESASTKRATDVKSMLERYPTILGWSNPRDQILVHLAGYVLEWNLEQDGHDTRREHVQVADELSLDLSEQLRSLCILTGLLPHLAVRPSSYCG